MWAPAIRPPLTGVSPASAPTTAFRRQRNSARCCIAPGRGPESPCRSTRSSGDRPVAADAGRSALEREAAVQRHCGPRRRAGQRRQQARSGHTGGHSQPRARRHTAHAQPPARPAAAAATMTTKPLVSQSRLAVSSAAPVATRHRDGQPRTGQHADAVAPRRPRVCERGRGFPIGRAHDAYHARGASASLGNLAHSSSLRAVADAHAARMATRPDETTEYAGRSRSGQKQQPVEAEPTIA